MKKFLLFGLFLAGLGLAGCEFNQLSEDEQVDELTLVPKQQTTGQKAKTASNQQTSPYSCLISTLADDEADYNYWNQAFWVHFPKPAVEQAEGKTIFKAFSYGSEHAGSKAGNWAGKENIVRVAQCIIPDSKLAESLLEEQLMKFGKNTWMESRKDVIDAPPKEGAKAKSASGDWECGQWYTVYVCKYNAEGNYYYDCTEVGPFCAYLVYVEGEDSGGGGGGGGGGFPGDDPGECDPMGTEPCFEGPGGGSQPPPPPPNPCDTSNPPDYCAEPDLCIGNPLPNPEVTPSGGWNTKGGTYGNTRSCNSSGVCSQFHDGIDLSAEVNTPLYSMHSGTVVGVESNFAPGEYKERSYGNYIIIESIVNGETIRLKYAHLNALSVTMGSTIYPGKKIGLTGNTGNAQTKDEVVVLPHVHVQGQKKVNGQFTKTNPNNYMATKFNSNGTVNTAASTCNQP